MLATILRLYMAGMAEEVSTPVPHLVGPPGCGKSTFVQEAADLLGVNLHVINVSRISPLELEGVQMPTDGALVMMLATYWNSLKDGDIVLLDEFLRGFPEVYNGLLDILSSRKVGLHTLPKVFFVAASNTTVAYDAALTDRLMHLPVPDPRSSAREATRIANVIVKELGLMPDLVNSGEMTDLLEEQVFPMYVMLDKTAGNQVTSNASKGMSPRSLIGQGKLRHTVSAELAALLTWNNALATKSNKYQFIKAFYYKNRFSPIPHQYAEVMADLIKRGKLTPEQLLNVELNNQLLSARHAQKGVDDDFI